MKEAGALAAVVLGGFAVAGLVESLDVWMLQDGWQVVVMGHVWEVVW